MSPIDLGQLAREALQRGTWEEDERREPPTPEEQRISRLSASLAEACEVDSCLSKEVLELALWQMPDESPEEEDRWIRYWSLHQRLNNNYGEPVEFLRDLWEHSSEVDRRMAEVEEFGQVAGIKFEGPIQTSNVPPSPDLSPQEVVDALCAGVIHPDLADAEVVAAAARTMDEETWLRGYFQPMLKLFGRSALTLANRVRDYQQHRARNRVRRTAIDLSGTDEEPPIAY